MRSNGPSFSSPETSADVSTVTISPVNGITFFHVADEKSSAMTTSSPSAANRLARFDPMNPAPPVTNTRTQPPGHSTGLTLWAADYRDRPTNHQPFRIGSLAETLRQPRHPAAS